MKDSLLDEWKRRLRVLLKYPRAFGPILAFTGDQELRRYGLMVKLDDLPELIVYRCNKCGYVERLSISRENPMTDDESCWPRAVTAAPTLSCTASSIDVLISVVSAEFATATPQRTFTAGKPVEVTRGWITEAGRRALA
jgi:hypothetical protein